jgi:hypothetical protein
VGSDLWFPIDEDENSYFSSDELQDLAPLPEIDYESIKQAMREMPIVISAELIEEFSKIDPFALPVDPTAESWDYYTKGGPEGERQSRWHRGIHF